MLHTYLTFSGKSPLDTKALFVNDNSSVGQLPTFKMITLDCCVKDKR